jgi:hypothetical protein
MSPSSAGAVRRRGTWALPEPSGVLLWRLGIGWSALAAVLDASTGKRIVLSGFVLLGPICVLFTGRWLRTALAGAWAISLVVVLGVPDGIWGSRLHELLIDLAVLVAVGCTLALVITFRGALSLAMSALLASCGGAAVSSGRRLTEPAARPVPCRSQYQAWDSGLVVAANRRMDAVVKAVQSAEKSGNAEALRSAMGQLMPAALAAAAAGGMPHCADPGGLYPDYIVDVYEAGDQASSARGLADLVKAAAPLRDLPSIDSQLRAEVRRVMAGI